MTGQEFTNDLLTLIGVVLSISGVIFFDTKKKKTYSNKLNSLDSVHTNAIELKNQLESTFNEEVQVIIDFNRLQPYGFNFGPLGTERENIEITNTKLTEGYDTLRDTFFSSYDISKTQLKSKFASYIHKQTNGLITIDFIGVPPVGRESKNDYLEAPKIMRLSVNRRLTFAIGTALISLGLFTAGSLIQQVYFSDITQLETQQQLRNLFMMNDETSEELGESENIISQKVNTEPGTYESPVLGDDSMELSDSGLGELFNNIFSEDATENIPDVFGMLEIPQINLEQYVVTGTSTEALAYGPGYYTKTSTPGNRGNVGIAGHRTTYGAPFSDLDKLQTGDEIMLTVGTETFKYIIDEILIVDPDQGERYLYNRGDERITLTTCHPKFSDKLRLIVTGSLEKKEQVN
ncbi:class E sortase [bacterium]|nr:class E sortase [bacterium]